MKKITILLVLLILFACRKHADDKVLLNEISSRFLLVSITVLSENEEKRIILSDADRANLTKKNALVLQQIAAEELKLQNAEFGENITRSFAGTYIVNLVFKDQKNGNQISSFVNLNENKDIIISALRDKESIQILSEYLRIIIHE